MEFSVFSGRECTLTSSSSSGVEIGPKLATNNVLRTAMTSRSSRRGQLVYLRKGSDGSGTTRQRGGRVYSLLS